MIEFNAEEISEEELIEAANKIFAVQEADFEKIKSEKWYQTLFHAITLNQDGKKYAVRGINSLTKLQQLFMSIYVNNYRKTHEQLDAVIEAVIQNSKAIKKIYGMCVLNLEEQESLEMLDSQDAEILAIFLGEYRDENGSVPSAVRDYNRGVLGALNQKVPNGILDNHQIRRLKAPKVVYRCFMEQCAVAGTIDTQEWTDKIYEDLKDFELSENSKNEIKASVKYEAEIAGIEYFIVKYSKNNAGVLDIDFEIDIEASHDPMAATRREIKKQLDLFKLSMALNQLIGGFIESIKLGGINFDEDLVTIDIPFEKEIKEDIANGEIKLPRLIDSINRSYADDAEIVFAFKFCKTDEDFNEHKHYFLIATMDGLFFFVRKKIAFIEYDALKSVRQDSSGVIVSAWKVNWYSENGLDESGADEVIVEKTKETVKYLRALRKGIEKLIEDLGGYVESVDDRVEEIVAKYIKKIPKSSSAVPYLVKDFSWNDDKSRKKMKKALSEYALKVRENEVIGFIDTSLFGNGEDGILFSKQGIAFDYAFEKVFVHYEEIDRMEIEKSLLGLLGKDLVLYGHFSERKDDVSAPSIGDTYYNLSVLKECLEEIKYVV